VTCDPHQNLQTKSERCGTDVVIGRILAKLPGLFLLAMGGGSAFLILFAMPSFDRNARVDGLFGDWRVPIASALYNRSDYLYQVGFGLLQGDLVASSVTEERDELASLETALNRAARGRRALEASAALAPGNAYTWTFIGWAAALEGDLEGALAAMETSWELAPWSFQLAPVRLSLFELLVSLDVPEDPLPSHLEAAGRDLEMLRRYDPRHYERLREEGGLATELWANLRKD